MHRYFFFFALFLVGCANNGDDGSTDTGNGPPVAHAPELVSVALLPETAFYMDGSGSIVTTVEIAFRDAGSDLRALQVRMPDDSIIEFAESMATETGTFSEDLTMSTQTVGSFDLEFWLVDQAGHSSLHSTAEFRVVADVQSSDWTNRLSGLPHGLSDVVWSGKAFIAVGGRGAIFTSADGINWVAINSGTDADLHAVAADGPFVIAVGYDNDPGNRGIILQSTDHGASWAVNDRPEEAVLWAVAINASQVVVGGYRDGGSNGMALISEDRGDTWQAVDSWPNEDLRMNDLVYRDGLFVASTFNSQDFEAWVTVSSDGKVWSEIAVSDALGWAVPHSIIHDGSQFILAGLGGTVFTSPDGVNWVQLQTPVEGVYYTCAAWSGSKLVLAGGSMCGLGLCDPQYVYDGISSTDGGMTWEIFNIDSDYVSRGLAWGNGRFVSVGEKSELDDESAIYTAE
jgi:hypothetical protein